MPSPASNIRKARWWTIPAGVIAAQVADYDIGVVVAQRIIARRASLGGFSDLAQLHGIRGFGADKFHDLLYSFARTVYEVSAIAFNYNTAVVTNDALNLRKNASTAAPSPAWQKGVSSTYSNSPALYAIKETQGNPLAIRVSFEPMA